MKMSVLVYEYPPKIVGGLGTYAAEITRKFVLMDNDVTVFTMNDDSGGLPTREIWRGIEIHRPLHIDISDSLPDVIAEDINSQLQNSTTSYHDTLITGRLPLPQVSSSGFSFPVSSQNAS